MSSSSALTSSEKKSAPFFNKTNSVQWAVGEETNGKVYSVANIPGTNYFATLSIPQDAHARNIGIIPEDKGEVTIWSREDNKLKKCLSFQSGCDMDRSLFVDADLNLIVCGKIKWGKFAFKYWKLSLSPSGIEATRTQDRIVEHPEIDRDVLLATLKNGDLVYSEKKPFDAAMIYFLKAGESKNRGIAVNSLFKSIQGLFLLPGEKKLLVIAKNVPPKISMGELLKLPAAEAKKYYPSNHISCLDLEKFLKSSTYRCEDPSVITEAISVDDLLGVDLDADIKHAVMLRNGEISLCVTDEDNTQIFSFNPTVLKPGAAKKICEFPGAVDKIAQISEGRWLFAGSESGFNLVWNEAKMSPVRFWGSQKDIENIIGTATESSRMGFGKSSSS